MLYSAHVKDMDYISTDLDASSFQEKILTEGNGLTQWTDGENLIVQVEKPRMEVLSLFGIKCLKCCLITEA